MTDQISAQRKPNRLAWGLGIGTFVLGGMLAIGAMAPADPHTHLVMENGQYARVTDDTAGTYTTRGPDTGTCTWMQFRSDFDPSKYESTDAETALTEGVRAYIDHGSVTSGHTGTVTLKPGEVFRSTDCDLWFRES